MRNIIFITNLHLWSLDKNKGGKAFYLTVTGYINAGWNVFLISTGGGIPEEISQVAYVIEDHHRRLEKWENSDNRVLSIFSRFLKQILHDRFYYKKASYLINTLEVKNTVVYAYEVAGVKSAKKLSNKFGIPLVTRFQGTILGNIKTTWLNRLKRNPHFGALQTKADLVIMTNDGTQGDRVLRELKNRSENILFWRNGVDGVNTSLVEPKCLASDSSPNFVFLTVSRLVNWKRVHLAIEGFKEISLKYPEARLIIVGEGAERENLEQLTRSLNLTEKITFAGAVAQNKVKEIMLSCDVFLSFYDLSNLGNPIMEAMISGLPVITIDVGDTGELIKNNENGLLIPSNQLEQIPVMMEKILVDSELRNILSRAALKTAKSEFITWEQRIENELLEVEKLILNKFPKS